jgi:predicted nucleic acid-binding protein
MRFLLDVSVLVSLGVRDHEFHDRAVRWLSKVAASGAPELATCAITELGFVRVIAQAPQYGFNVDQARRLLLQIKADAPAHFTFIPDDHDVSHLPESVKTPKQTTDGHLAQLARANGAVFATFDRGIPGAFVVPNQ